MSDRDENAGGTATRVLFVPWAAGQSDQHDRVQKWKAKATKAFDYVPYTGEESPLIAGLGRYDVLYVKGHGDTWPTDAITPNQIRKNGDYDLRLEASTLLQRLDASGLKKSWDGDLKLHCCFSGGNFDPDSEADSFAKKFAAVIQDYKCCLYGYPGSIDSIPTDDGHRYGYKEDTRLRSDRGTEIKAVGVRLKLARIKFKERG